MRLHGVDITSTRFHETGREIDALPRRCMAIPWTSVQLSFDTCALIMYKQFYVILGGGSAWTRVDPKYPFS